jgi:hypothetical protein
MYQFGYLIYDGISNTPAMVLPDNIGTVDEKGKRTPPEVRFTFLCCVIMVERVV